MRHYHIRTFGCQMNHSDSERISAFLESRGFKYSESIDRAHLVVINTCGVRQMAEDRVYGLVHNLKKNDASKLIVITGCISHRKDVRRRLEGKVDLFTEIKDFPLEVADILRNASDTDTLIHGVQDLMHGAEKLPDKEQMDYLSIHPKRTDSFQAYVPIMTGCNNFCAYCVVPYARGREVSRPTDEIVSEVRSLVESGYKHIILLGQNVNSYNSTVRKIYKVRNVSKEKIEEINFSKLLKKIGHISGKFWISFISSHPKDMSDELIETVARSKKICEYIHLPLQSGDDEIIRRMNRKYTQKHYLKLVEKIRRAFETHKPDALYALTSDIIVGFPGETRAQLLETAKVMEKARYDMVYFGQFSPRPGTAAWNMKDNVSKKEKERREKYLNGILSETTYANNKKYVGKTLEVFIEKEKEGVYFGKTRTMKNIKLPAAKKGLTGSLVMATVTRANDWNLEGVLEKK